MTSDEIRARFLDFFSEREHLRIPSASLVPPPEDRTVLLTTAGMQPLKPYFLGREPPPAPRLTSCQKCFRTPDIDHVGSTLRHLTFFEMLGNFSIGAYFKAEAIRFAWDLSLQVFSFDPSSIWVTVFAGDERLGLGPDEEAIELWQSTGVPRERIVACPRAENFWEAGPVGPSGPCSELYIDRGLSFGAADDLPGGDNERFLEYWNLVFMQYDQRPHDQLQPLPTRNIDTGLGLNRLAAILQGRDSVFATDQFQPLIDLGRDLAGRSGDDRGGDGNPGGEGNHGGEDDHGGDGDRGGEGDHGRGGDRGGDDRDQAAGRALRILADHARGMSFLIADGVVPSNEDRGYVLRRLTRRAILQGRRLGMAPGFLVRYAALVRELMAGAYPELHDQRDAIERWLSSEEDAFGRTLEQGTRLLDELIARALDAGEDTIAAADAFALHDTYGFPADLTRELAGERGLGVDEQGFERLMDAQRARARAAAQGAPHGAMNGAGGDADPRELARELAASAGPSTRFTGYETELQRTTVAALSLVPPAGAGGAGSAPEPPADEPSAGGHTGGGAGGGTPVRYLLKLAESPFYPAGGGQVSDAGTIECEAETRDGGEGEGEGGKGEGGNGEGGNGEGEKGDDGEGEGEGGKGEGGNGEGGNGGGPCLARVTGVFRLGDDQALEVSLERGSFAPEQRVIARVDHAARRATERNHTATHLLHAALRERLGAHVRQAGSYVGPDKLRFDFTHTGALSAQELRDVEDAVNARIADGAPVRAISTTLEEARRLGAMALFGEKYGEVVRMVQIGDGSYSRELCGGTHVRSTAEIGVFRILSETSSAANVRRIEALTGAGAGELLRAHDRELAELASILRTAPARVLATVRERERILREIEQAAGTRAERVPARLRSLFADDSASPAGAALASSPTALAESARPVGGVPVVAQTVAVPSARALPDLADQVRGKLSGEGVIVLGAVVEDRAALVVSVGPALVARGLNAGELVKIAAAPVGGGGGGRPTLAQAGGREPGRLDDALAAAVHAVARALGGEADAEGHRGEADAGGHRGEAGAEAQGGAAAPARREEAAEGGAPQEEALEP